MSVQTTHKDYNRFYKQIRLVRDAIEGQEALLQNAKSYFPKLQSQDELDYRAIIKRPAYDNYVEQYLDVITGKLINKDPIVQVHERLKPLLNNINLLGNTDTDFVQDLAFEILTGGKVGVLVDYFDGGLSGPTFMSEIEAKARPYAKIYPTESIINWRVDNNKLTMVVLKEIAQNWVSEFEVVDVEQYTVLYIDNEDGKFYRKIMRIDSKNNQSYLLDGSIIAPTIRGQKIDFIPFYIANQNTLDTTTQKPPLYNIANNNISLHRLKIDYYSSLFYIGSPVAYISNLDNEMEQDTIINLGASVVYKFNGDVKMNYLEFTGQGLASIEREIDKCKDTIAAMGADFLKQDVKNEAFQTVQLRNDKNNSSIMNTADVISRLMTKILETFAMFYDIKEPVSYDIDTEFENNKIDSALVKVMVDANQLGAVSDNDLFNVLSKADLTVAETFDEWQSTKSEQQIPLKFTSK